MQEVYTYKEARRLLRQSGSKVCAEVKADDIYLVLEKKYFLDRTKDRRVPTNYDGDDEYFLWDAESKVLYIPMGRL